MMIAICNNIEQHQYWSKKRWPCPACAAIRDLRKQEDEQRRFANLVAEAVVLKLKEAA